MFENYNKYQILFIGNVIINGKFIDFIRNTIQFRVITQNCSKEITTLWCIQLIN